jgi:hypothetical protein
MKQYHDYFTSVRFNAEEAKLVRELADTKYGGSIAKAIREGIKHLAAKVDKVEGNATAA